MDVVPGERVVVASGRVATGVSDVPAEMTVRLAAVSSPGLADVRLLDARELALVARLHRRKDRERAVARHVLLRRLVAEVSGVDPGEVRLTARCPACGGPHGRPVVTGPVPDAGTGAAAGAGAGAGVGAGAGLVPVTVSMSSSGSWVAAAVRVGDRDVGIDVQSVDEVAAGPVADLLGRREVAFGAIELSRIWARKEAVLKATGDGLRVSPSDLVVSAPDAPPRLLSWRGRELPPVSLHDLDAPTGYVAALAVLG